MVRWKHGGQLQEKHQALCAPSPHACSCFDMGARGRVKRQNNGVRGQGKDPLLKEPKPDPSFHPRPTASLRLRGGCWQERAGFPGSLGRGAALSSHSLSLTPQPHLLPAPNRLKQILKETQAVLPHLEMAFPKSAP